MIKILTTSLFIGFICFSAVGQKKNTNTVNSLKDKLIIDALDPLGEDVRQPLPVLKASQCFSTWEQPVGVFGKLRMEEVPGKIFLTDFGGSIGAIDVSQSNPNIIYVGGGEVTVRGNVSTERVCINHLTEDEGEFGRLTNSRHIPRTRIHPNNPDIVYGSIRDLFKDSEER